jgi:protoporphyrinogen IX oxidase
MLDAVKASLSYDWIRALHIIFVIALMAGLLIYPRYKVHQVASQPGEPLFETMKAAALRLKRIILNPALILTWAFGLTMLWLNPGLLSNGWMHVKLLLVLVLSGVHGWFIGIGKKIDSGAGYPVRRLRLINEVPFVLMAIIVILAVAEPF